MIRLGSWSTFDCPSGGREVIDRAYDWLFLECSKIGAFVRKVINPHDGVGSYLSFEIDWDGWRDIKDQKWREMVINSLNDLEERYIKKFAEWL